MEPCRAGDDHKGGVESQYGDLEGLKTSSRRFTLFDEQDPDPDPHRSKKTESGSALK
jgi:hypothetical protein